jgi:hypothetical protein
MRGPLVFILLLGGLLLLTSPGCKEEYKKGLPSGVNVVVQDVPCKEVIQGILGACRQQNLSWSWADQNQGRLHIGPVSDTALPPDQDMKTEERIRLEITCLDSLSTRISLVPEVRLLTPDQKWKTVTEPEALQAYGKRFLDRLLKHAEK